MALQSRDGGGGGLLRGQGPQKPNATAAPAPLAVRSNPNSGRTAQTNAPTYKEQWSARGNESIPYVNQGQRQPLARRTNPDPTYSNTLRAQGYTELADRFAPQGPTPEQRSRADMRPAIGGFQVKQLTMDEWNALSGDQRAAVTANWALYNARGQDQSAKAEDVDEGTYRASAAKIFGTEDGRSKKVAPNVLSVLSEFGYKDDAGDVDDFLDGSAVTDYSSIQSGEFRTAKTGSSNILQRLVDSEVFKAPEIRATLDRGDALLATLRDTSILSGNVKKLSGIGGDDPLKALSQQDAQELDEVLIGMQSREVYNRIQNEPETNQRLQSDIDLMKQKYGEETFSKLLRSRIGNYAGDEFMMSADEFFSTWFNKEK